MTATPHSEPPTTAATADDRSSAGHDTNMEAPAGIPPLSLLRDAVHTRGKLVSLIKEAHQNIAGSALRPVCPDATHHRVPVPILAQYEMLIMDATDSIMAIDEVISVLVTLSSAEKRLLA